MIRRGVHSHRGHDKTCQSSKDRGGPAIWPDLPDRARLEIAAAAQRAVRKVYFGILHSRKFLYFPPLSCIEKRSALESEAGVATPARCIP